MDSLPEALPRRTLLKGAVVLGAVTLLPACSRSSEDDDGAAATLSVTDQRGTTLELDGPVQRIVTVPMPAASIVIAVDQGADRLVGMHEASWVAARDSILGTMFPTTLDTPHDIASETFAPNVESVLALEPDLVVQWANQDDGILAPLENAGLDVLGVDYGTLEDVGEWFTMFATVLGKPERGRSMATRLDADRADTQARAATREGPKPSVLYFNRFHEGLKVAGTETFNDEYIRLVGAENAGADVTGLAEADLEQVLSWDPDIVVLGNFDDAVPSDVYGDRRWKDVAAVRERRVYKAPLGGYRWDPPSHESPLMWRWLGQLAYPDGTDGGLLAKVREDYRYFYGQAPDATQIATMLWTEENGASADYQPFSAT